MRKNCTRVKNVDTVHGIMPFLMKKRCEAEVYYVERIDVTKLLKYLDKINEGKEKHEKTTLFHAIITATAKTVYNRPLLNRFISGQRYYDRNEISFGFVAKNKSMLFTRTAYFLPLVNVLDVEVTCINAVCC